MAIFITATTTIATTRGAARNPRVYQEAQYFKLSPWPGLSTSGKAKKFLYKYLKGVLIKEKTSHFQMSCAATEGIEELYI